MPRASTDTTEEAPKRAPRKRAVRRTVTKTDAPVRRTRTPRASSVRDNEESITVSTPVRKAPTPFAAKAAANNSVRKRLIITGVAFLLVSGVAAFIGFSDDGVIDVSSRIKEANERVPVAIEEVNGDGGTQTEGQVPVQSGTPPAAISGLRGRGVGTPPVEQAAPVVEEATTTDEVSTSTDESVTTAEEGVVPEGDSVDTTTTE